MATPAKRENKRCASGRKRSAATPTRPNARRTCTIGRPQLLGGFAGEFSPKGHSAPTFPQVSRFDAAQHPPKSAQKSRPMAKSAPIFCKTAQKSQGACSRAKSAVSKEHEQGTKGRLRLAAKLGEGGSYAIAQAERGISGKSTSTRCASPHEQGERGTRVNRGRRRVQGKTQRKTTVRV